MSDSVGEQRPPRGATSLKPSDLTVAGARPAGAAGWLDALRALASQGDELLAREATLRPARRRPGRDDGGLLVSPRHDGGPRGPRTSPANALFDLAA